MGGVTLTTVSWCLLALLAAAGSVRSDSPESTRAQPADGTVAFAPGVRIDWKRRCVEVDAKVVLRRGPLELLACSPQTREHESIFVVGARPLSIYQAMGLIGLEPGTPARFDEASDKWFPPVGAGLSIRVRCGSTDSALIPVERWLRRMGDQEGPADVAWVFSGSRKSGAGRFLADLDGTVICVVDFASALISIGAVHSADNEALWLEANTEAIPPIGTACTLVIAAQQSSVEAVRVVVGADGSLSVASEALSFTQLVDRAKPLSRLQDEVVLRIEGAIGVDIDRLLDLKRRLIEAGVPIRAVRIDTDRSE